MYIPQALQIMKQSRLVVLTNRLGSTFKKGQISNYKKIFNLDNFKNDSIEYHVICSSKHKSVKNKRIHKFKKFFNIP